MKKFRFEEFNEKMMNSPLLEGQGIELRYKKGSHIFRQGEICTNVFCMRRGLVKVYYNTLDGKEWIKTFIADQGLIGSRSSQALNMPSLFSTICLEDTEVIQFPYHLFEEACFEDMELARTAFQFVQWLGVRKELREYQLLCVPVEEAYQNFMLENAKVVSRLTQVDIARYLGITPVALSRIKKRPAD